MAGAIIQASDVVSRVRILIAEPNTNRWPDNYLASLFSDAQTRIASDMADNGAPYPTKSDAIVGQSGVPRYQLFPTLRVLRVYLHVPNVATQLLPGSDISTLEGDNLLVYDASSGTIAPPSNPTMSPQWMSEQPQSYPVVTDQGNRSPIGTGGVYQSVSVDPTQRAECFIEGGYIGIVPPPLGTGWSLIVDHVPIPPDIVLLSDYTYFPQNFRDALAYDVILRMMLSDGRDGQAQVYESKYGAELIKLVAWRNNLQSNKPKRLSVIPKRVLSSWVR